MVSPFLGEYLPNKSFRLNWTGDGEAREKKKGYKTTFMRRRKGKEETSKSKRKENRENNPKKLRKKAQKKKRTEEVWKKPIIAPVSSPCVVSVVFVVQCANMKKKSAKSAKKVRKAAQDKVRSSDKDPAADSAFESGGASKAPSPDNAAAKDKDKDRKAAAAREARAVAQALSAVAHASQIDSDEEEGERSHNAAAGQQQDLSYTRSLLLRASCPSVPAFPHPSVVHRLHLVRFLYHCHEKVEKFRSDLKAGLKGLPKCEATLKTSCFMDMHATDLYLQLLRESFSLDEDREVEEELEPLAPLPEFRLPLSDPHGMPLSPSRAFDLRRTAAFMLSPRSGPSSFFR